MPEKPATGKLSKEQIEYLRKLAGDIIRQHEKNSGHPTLLKPLNEIIDKAQKGKLSFQDAKNKINDLLNENPSDRN